MTTTLSKLSKGTLGEIKAGFQRTIDWYEEAGLFKEGVKATVRSFDLDSETLTIDMSRPFPLENALAEGHDLQITMPIEDIRHGSFILKAAQDATRESGLWKKFVTA
jgi:hypothetical protein